MLVNIGLKYYSKEQKSNNVFKMIHNYFEKTIIMRALRVSSRKRFCFIPESNILALLVYAEQLADVAVGVCGHPHVLNFPQTTHSLASGPPLTNTINQNKRP